MSMLELLPWLALKRIFKYADMESCINMHEIVNIREEEWRKKIVRLYGEQPEELIFEPNITKNKLLACINTKIDINTKTYYRNTALHIASMNGYKEIVELLIDKGADINAKNNIECTALHIVSYDGNYEIAELLIDKGAEINAKNNNRYTPLILAYCQGQKDIVELLIDRGAKINKKKIYVNRSLNRTIQDRQKEIDELLKSKAAIE